MKAGHEVKLHRNEVNTVRRMCGLTYRENVKRITGIKTCQLAD